MQRSRGRNELCVGARLCGRSSRSPRGLDGGARRWLGERAGTDPVGRTWNVIHVSITYFQLSDERARRHVKRQNWDSCRGSRTETPSRFGTCKNRSSVNHSQTSVLRPFPSPHSPAFPWGPPSLVSGTLSTLTPPPTSPTPPVFSTPPPAGPL